MFEFISRGVGRNVYAINDDKVLKLPRNAIWGKLQCKNELQVFKLYGNKFPLCKIDLTNSSEDRIIMERVISFESLPDLDFDYTKLTHIVEVIRYKRETKEFINELAEPIKKFVNKILNSGLTRNQISAILNDVCLMNLGYKDGEIVILDYGYVDEKELDIA
ncbi:hypothetical protein DQT32_03765 [Salmonella enterica subsp. enterica serovar Braenderup]|nr:hypothetical protein [Salmonella enterica subsp. enterica serovar Braenderup]